MLLNSTRKKKQQQPRQLLSCTKCRERKVKCDRTKPCSACCARGQPKECHFVVGEGGDYGPIQQSYELRKLRAENLRLKEQLRAEKSACSDDEDEPYSPVDGPFRNGGNGGSKLGNRQKKFKSQDAADSLYFGSPGLANIVNDATLGLQLGSWDRNGGRWTRESLEVEISRGDVYTAMQALRMASFMSRPTLLAIQSLIIISPYLTNSGRFLDAWTLFGSTIRLAHSIGLHRNPRYLEPAPPLRECATRQTLWWWILHMDQHYSMTLGRPLGISGIGDCPPPEPLTTDPTILRFSEFVNQFTVLARQVLSSDRLSNGKIDDFTDKLQSLWDTLPEMLQFDETWLDEDKSVPEWPLNVMAGLFYGKLHNYIILLNRQRLENTQRSESPLASPTVLHGHPQYPFPSVSSSQQYAAQYYHPQQYHQAYNSAYPISRRPSQQQYPPSHSSRSNHSAATTPSSSSPQSGPAFGAPIPRGRPAVIISSIALLTAFVFYSKREPQALICWSICQGAFNASMILLLDAMEMGPTESSRNNMHKVHVCWRVFKGLEEHGVHKLAALARRKVGEGLGSVQEVWAKKRKDNAEERGMRQENESLSGTSRAGRNNVRTEQGGESAVNANGQNATVALGYGDTVMGNTGMLLLEDPGLQAFRPEGFAPLKWDMVGGDLAGMQENQGRSGVHGG
ncbi:MAG: hypothetical protein Q9157_000213 [Trypethelium eluteriae]